MAKSNSLLIDYEFECLLVGIVTQLRDYQFAWLLNQSFLISLRKEPGYELHFRKKNISVAFPWFKYDDPLNKNVIHLLGNKAQSEFILPEIKQADFLFMIQGYVSSDYQKTIIEKLKALVPVQTFVVLNANELKSKENLIIE